MDYNHYKSLPPDTLYKLSLKAMSSISNDIVILLYLSNKMLTAFIS